MSETKTKKKPSISVVLPMFNERAYLRKTVSMVLAAMEEITDDFEVIIVDDASTDGSGAMADELARSSNRIHVFHHSVNSRLGSTLRTGFKSATRDLILYSDMDLPFDWEEVKKGLRIMEITNCAIVTAYRHDRTNEGWARTFYSAVFNMLVAILFGVRIRDVNFSFKLMKKDVLDSINLESCGSFIDAEIIIKAHRLGYGISQFGIDYFPRSMGKSHLANASQISQILKEMIKIRFKLWASGTGKRNAGQPQPR